MKILFCKYFLLKFSEMSEKVRFFIVSRAASCPEKPYGNHRFYSIIFSEQDAGKEYGYG
jgi:hypothetical protein